MVINRRTSLPPAFRCARGPHADSLEQYWTFCFVNKSILWCEVWKPLSCCLLYARSFNRFSLLARLFRSSALRAISAGNNNLSCFFRVSTRVRFGWVTAQQSRLARKSRFLWEQGWYSGESTRLPPMWPGFKFWRQRHMLGSVCCWFSPLLREVFLQVLRFSPLLKNHYFHIDLEHMNTFKRVLNLKNS